MKSLIWILGLMLVSSAHAQIATTKPVRSLTPDVLVKMSAQSVRAHKKEIREFYMQVVLRKAQMDIATVLSKKGIPEAQIQALMNGHGMKKLLTRLEQNPKIQAKVDLYVEKLVKPGSIEVYVAKQYERLTKEMQEQTLIARNELQKSATYRTEENVHEFRDDRTFITKLWDHLITDLYNN